MDSNEVADGVVLYFDSNGAQFGINVQHDSQMTDILSIIVTTAFEWYACGLNSNLTYNL